MALRESERDGLWAIWMIFLLNFGLGTLLAIVFYNPLAFLVVGLIFASILFLGLSVAFASWLLEVYRANADSPAAGEDQSEDLYPDNRLE
jgi:hypothetical protein